MAGGCPGRLSGAGAALAPLARHGQIGHSGNFPNRLDAPTPWRYGWGMRFGQPGPEGTQMMDKVYALAARTEQDCDQVTASSPINGLKVGDVVVTGYGTLTWHYREVVDVTTVPEIGCYQVTFADGRSTTDSANGFWYAVIKGDAEAQRQATEAAAAFARAWDRRR